MNISDPAVPSGRDDEEPTSAAELVILPARIFGRLKGSRNRETGRRPPRWPRVRLHSAAPQARVKNSASAVPAQADPPAAEAPTTAAELTVILLPYSFARRPCQAGPKNGRAGQSPRRWTRPPGSGPP